MAEQDIADGWAFKIGDRVRKHSGSWWEGRVVGFYSTTQTPRGYDVQMDIVPNGPVQIYPESALEPAPKAETAASLRQQLAEAEQRGMEKAAKLIEEGFDRGIKRKVDTCAHGKFEWEDCERCAVAAIRTEAGKAALEEKG